VQKLDSGSEQPERVGRQDHGVVLSFRYLLFRLVLELAVGRREGDFGKDVEIRRSSTYANPNRKATLMIVGPTSAIACA